MNETWIYWEKQSIDEKSMLLDSAKRLMIIAILLQVIYFVILLFSDVEKNSLVQANKWHFFELALLIIPLLIWFISLTIAVHVLIGSMSYFALRCPKSTVHLSDEHFEENTNDIRLNILKGNSRFIQKNIRYLRHAYYLILAGFFWLLIIAFCLLWTHGITETISNPSQIDSEVYVANASQINTLISIPSVAIHLNYSGGEPAGLIHTNLTNATDLMYKAPPEIGYIKSVVISIGFLLFMIILMWIFGYWLSKREKTNASVRWWNYPLGLPKGSVRAMIALLFVIALLLYGKQQDPWLMGIVGAIIGFYFGERKGEEDT